ASGFIGNALYKELYPYFDTHGTFCTDNTSLARNRKFHQFDLEREPVGILLEQLRPNIIISAVRGNFDAQIIMHQEIIQYLHRHSCKLVFLSSSNVFDAFTNYPSYEYD